MKIHSSSEPVLLSQLSVKRENIIKALGVPYDEADYYLCALIDELIGKCLEICTPCASVNLFDQPVFSLNPGTMVVDDITFNLNRMVTSALAESTSVAFFTGTCGEKTEKLSKKLMSEGQSLEGLIVDLIGSELAEDIAGTIHKKLEEDMALLGFRTTNRYSPGYCNWHVSDQQKLFDLIGTNNCGIHLTESSLMIPIKSISGIIGVGKNVTNRGYACSWCESNYCLYRDKR